MALDISAKKVYGALKKDVSAIDSKVDNAILSIYKAGGSLEFDNLPSLSSDVANMAYLVTDAFTTTSDFVEGAGVDYPAGTYVAIVNTGTEDDPDYKYDAVPFTMIIDDTMSAVSENPLQNKVITGAVQEIRLSISNLSASKISKSETVGHVMNDGSIDENDYADKVTNATSGHLAGLDANGNLTDSGVSPTEDVTVEGNPVTFESPFEQDAKSVVVSVKPIQDLHGYDHPWVAGGGKNKLPLVLADIKAANTSGTWLGNVYTISDATFTINTDNNDNVISIIGVGNGSAGNTLALPFNLIAESYMLSSGFNELLGSNDTYLHDGTSVIARGNSNSPGQSFTLASDTNVTWYFRVVSNTQHICTPMIRLATESDASFAPYSNICPISGIDEVEIEVSDGEGTPTTTTIPLPSTMYGGEENVTEGSGTEDWTYKAITSSDSFVRSFVEQGYAYYRLVNTTAKPNAHMMCNGLKAIAQGEHTDGYEVFANQNGDIFFILPENVDASSTIKDVISIAYEIATPTTLSFDPTDVELLDGTNVVSTNGEKVAVTYGRSLWQDIADLKTDTEGKLNKSDVADVEGDTASRPYSVNDFMLRSDGFYKVTAPIASGASITSSNTTKTTVGEVLTALLNA